MMGQDLRGALGVMLGCDGAEFAANLWRAPDGDLRELAPALVNTMHSLQGLASSVLSEIDQRGLFRSWGCVDAAAFLATTTTLSHAESRKFGRTAKNLAHHPELRDGFNHHAFGAHHADLVAKFLDTKKHKTKLAGMDDGGASVMRVLLRDAANNDTTNLRNSIAAFTAMFAALDTDPDTLPDAEDPDLDTLDAVIVDGRLVLRGDFNTLTAELFMNLLSALSKPVPGPDGTKDRRTATQRRAEALKQIMDWYAAHADTIPTQGGRRPVLDIHMPVDDLYTNPTHADTAKKVAFADFNPGFDPTTPTPAPDAAAATPYADIIDNIGGDALARRGVGVTHWAGPVSRASVLKVGCDSDFTRTCTVGAGNPVNIGLLTRRIPAALRAAVAARDGGCVFPNCTRPPEWCHVHHLDHWADGGPTDLENLGLLCSYHHHVVHDCGWRMYRGDDGLIWFVPPPDLDPLQRPIPANQRGRPSVITEYLLRG